MTITSLRFMRSGLAAPAALAVLFLAPLAWPAEIYTNGAGGGDWSETTTWRGGTVPGPADTAVISREDRVTFARNDATAPTCMNLYMDPRSALVFKPRMGPVMLTIGGSLESYGSIVLDGARGADDTMEIRFIHEDIEQRKFKIMKGGSLVLVGRELADGIDPNVRLTSHPANEKEKDPVTRLTAEDGAGVDLRRTKFDNVAVIAISIDNTGAEYNERVSVIENRFTGSAYLSLSSCDSAVVTDNHFNRDPALSWLQPAALHLAVCPLIEVRGTVIRGPYYYGINSYACSDANILDTTIDGAHIAVYWYGENAMIRNTVLRNGNIGFMLNYMSGVIDGLLTDTFTLPIYNAHANAQVSNWRAEKITEQTPRAAAFAHGRLTLLNCDIKPELVSFDANVSSSAKPEEPDKTLVQCMQFLVVGVKGEMPPGTRVEVKTANPNPPIPPGGLDMNVRNSPAGVQSNRLTPLPGTIQSLVLRSWSYDPTKKLTAAPQYTLTLLGPANAEGVSPTLKTQAVQPAPEWFRPLPDDPIATVEVTLP